jgi:hypothetical protein
MGRAQCCETIADFEEWATEEVRGVLEAAGFEDVAQYRVQVLWNGAEPVCPTPQQAQMARRASEKIAAEMGIPLYLLGGEAAGE